MTNLLRKVRAILFMLFVILAAAAAGASGAYIPFRRNYQNNEIKIEMVDRKKSEEESNESESKN